MLCILYTWSSGHIIEPAAQWARNGLLSPNIGLYLLGWFNIPSLDLVDVVSGNDVELVNMTGGHPLM